MRPGRRGPRATRVIRGGVQPVKMRGELVYLVGVYVYLYI